MEFRVLQYFLAVTREQSISGAAEALHLSQPTLSRQLKDMEEELGKQLMIRGSRRITLTEEGMLLRKRAEEIVELVRKTQDEISLSDETIAGDVYIGAGETEAVRLIARTAKQIQIDYPNVHYHISSGDTTDVMDNLDKGLIDFGLVFSSVDTQRYDSITFPIKDTYGLLIRQDSPLAAKDQITPEDLWDKPLIFNRNAKDGGLLSAWMKRSISELNVVATYNLLYNGSLMVDEGLGYAVCLDGIINTEGSSLCFKPFTPKLEAGMQVIWKKYSVFSKAADYFLQQLQHQLEGGGTN